MAWSEAQLQAITTYNKNLLVAAAAGSGKTSVLVERIIRRLLDEKQKFNIDKVLVVTFTNAAAAEMRERIGNAISKALKERPKSRHLERQLVLLNAASISTIHAFCQNVIRQNFHLLDIDPKFRLANEQETNLLKQDVLETLFEEKYTEADADFLTFVDHYGNERSDEELYEIILDLYKFSCSQPYPRVWLERLKDSFALAEDTDIDTTVWAKLIRQQLELAFLECQHLLDEMILNAQQIDFDFYVPTFEADRELIDRLANLLEAPWDELQKTMYAVKFATMARAPKETDEALKKIFSDKRGKVKKIITTLKDNYFTVTGAEQIADLIQVEPMMATICQLTIQFAESFAAAKRTKAIADFNDLEHFCLKILLHEEATPENAQPSAVAKALQEKYEEVMVDEYQDTNGVQEAIISLVRKAEKPNLFLVGDVKQSVYRFRLAEPELFLEKYRNYPTSGESFARIDLAQNFRSRKEILAAINFLFCQLMSPKVAELSYGEPEKLNPGTGYVEIEQKLVAGAVELSIIDRDSCESEEFHEQDSETQTADNPQEEEELSGFALEATFIAQRIQTLMDESTYVFDKETKTYRPLAWRDIVILLRSVKNKANVLLETLRNANIPSYANVDSGYFQEIEIQIMLALLHVIDNPYQDIPLASVLHSPIVGLSTIELAEIRLTLPQAELWSAVIKANAVETELNAEIKVKLSRFIAQVNEWRNLARRKSVPELIWQLFRDTGYYDYVGGMPGGMLRQANLRMLYDRAGQYETTNFRGLFRFLRFIEKMRDTGTDLAVARTLGESENVVRIMSIHKSKGLEFPVVIVADLGKQFNLMDSKGTLLMHRKLGLGPYVTNGDLEFRYPTIARQAIAYKMNMESKAEELRVLYVALTRAREKLILVGSVAKLSSKANAWSQHIASSNRLLPDYAIAGASTYLDWVCPAVVRHADGETLLKAADTTQMRINAIHEDTSHWQVSIIPASDVLRNEELSAEDNAFMQKVEQLQPLAESDEKDWVKSVLDWQYPDMTTKEVPAKLSVTEMKRRFDLAQQAENPIETIFKKPVIVTRPRFIQEKTKLTGAEYGTLMHSVMQHIDIFGDVSMDGLKAQLARLVLEEKILPEHAEVIDLNGVQSFFASDIGKRMLAAHNIRRELPFSVMLQAKRFYPDMKNAEEHIFVQGIIDVIFNEGEEMVLVDYKTDHSYNVAELTEKYALQLNIYAEAIEKILKKKVKEKYLYLFHSGKLLQVE
jgi:ATP-dependent helicase/nuclease subunit A